MFENDVLDVGLAARVSPTKAAPHLLAINLNDVAAAACIAAVIGVQNPDLHLFAPDSSAPRQVVGNAMLAAESGRKKASDICQQGSTDLSDPLSA